MRIRITVKLIWKILSISLILISLFLLGMSYVGYRLYKNITTTQKTIIENQDKEQKSRDLITLQQSALNQANTELIKTKSDAEKTNAEIKNLTQVINNQAKDPKNITISSSDLAPYLTSVVQVLCSTPTNISSGSGTLWTFKNIPYAVMTNYHVIKGSDKCVVSITNTANETIGIFSIKDTYYTFNKDTDEAILTIGDSIYSKSVPIANYNYSLGKVRACTTLMPVGTPVVIIGFPAYAKRNTTLDIDTLGTVNVIYRAVTNGIISGYDTSQKGEANYFVSAKIDNGNSGGMTLAKDTNGLCVLGLPTWLTVGNYETQGLVQNILNLLPTN